MIETIKPYLEPVKGNTYCIVTGYCRIPLYKLNEKEVVLIDSGLPGDWEGILQCLEAEGLWVKAVLTSHSHPDHVGNHLNLRRRFGTVIYMSLYAAAVYANPMNRTASTLGMGTYRRLRKNMGDGFAPDRLLDWNAPSVEVEGASFGILQTPGHDAEHMGFVTPDNVAYLGDAVLSAHIIEGFRSPYCTCVELDLASKELLAGTQYDRYILAHNEVCDSVRDLAQRNIEVFMDRAEEIVELAGEYVTLEGLVQKLMQSTGGRLDTVRRVMGTRHNVTVLADYLTDTGRLECRARDGLVEYIRKELTP